MVKPEHWILLALKDASQGYGFDINKWYLSEKPDEFDINNTDFQNLINTLETQGILKRALREPINFYLSDKGKKEFNILKKQLKFKEYISIISNFPEIELKERVRSLESFVLLSMILVVGTVFILGLIQVILLYKIDMIYFILILFFFVLIVSYYVGNTLGSITLFWINDVQRETFWIYKEWFWNNRGVINKVISCLFIIVIIVLFDYFQLSKLKDSFVLVIFGIICIWLYDILWTKKLEKGS